jgi:BASS family bile acid:Na+ symporter
MDFLFAFFSLTIFTMMLTIGVNQSPGHLISLWQQPALLFRSLLAVVVLVPAVVFALLWFFDLSPAVATGLAILAAAPGAPLTTKRSEIAAADPVYTTSLQLALALLAVLVTPLILAIFYAAFSLTIEAVSPIEVAKQIGKVTFLPVIIGLSLQHFAPKLVATISKPLNILATVLLALLVLAVTVVIVMAPELRAGLNVGGPALVAILIIAIAAVAIGHLLGGDNPARRGGLAVASVARNIGLALYILGLTDSGQEVAPTVLVFLLVGLAVAVPYSLWIRRQIN